MTDAEYTAAVDNGSYTNFIKDSAGYGLAQWTYWSRKQKLLEYAQKAKTKKEEASKKIENETAKTLLSEAFDAVSAAVTSTNQA